MDNIEKTTMETKIIQWNHFEKYEKLFLKLETPTVSWKKKETLRMWYELDATFDSFFAANPNQFKGLAKEINTALNKRGIYLTLVEVLSLTRYTLTKWAGIPIMGYPKPTKKKKIKIKTKLHFYVSRKRRVYN